MSDSDGFEYPTEAPSTSIATGVGTVVDGLLDIASSAMDAQANGVQFVADLAAMDYHAAAAGVDAFFNDMDGAKVQNEAFVASRGNAWGDISAIGDDIGL